MSVNKHIKGTLCDCKSTEKTFKTECHSILTYLTAILFHIRFVSYLQIISRLRLLRFIALVLIDDLIKHTSFLDRFLSSFKQAKH